MTSLADELDLDPAFDDVEFSNGVPMSLEEERPESPIRESMSSSSTKEYRHRRQQSIDGNDGFSLADELSKGPSNVVHQKTPPQMRKDETLGGLDSAHYEGFSDSQRTRDNREYFLYASETVAESTRHTNAFLDKLRKVADVRTGSMSTRPSASQNWTSPDDDDTSNIESTAAAMVKQIHEQVMTREAQVRELQEYDRILRRAFEEGGEYLAALAGVDSISDKDSVEFSADDKDPLGITSTLLASHHDHNATLSPSVDRLERRSTFEPNEDDSLLSLAADQSSYIDTRSSFAEEKHTVFADLIHLQTSTSELIASLGIIHEHSQIAQASMGDATRLIRNIRTVLSNWQSEILLLEQSQHKIIAFEAGNAESDDNALHPRPTDVKAWTQSQLKKFEHILDDAHAKAQELLKPVHDPALDRLAQKS